MQAGKPALIKKDGGEMLIAIVLDRPLPEAKALVEAPLVNDLAKAMKAVDGKKSIGGSPSRLHPRDH